MLFCVRYTIFSGFELEGCAVYTEPLPRRVWSILKHMAKVGITLFDKYTLARLYI